MKFFFKYFFTFIFIFYNYVSGFSQPELLTTDASLTISNVVYSFNDGNEFGEEQISTITKLKSGDIFSENEFNLDMMRIRRFYFDHGYFDCIVDTSTILNDQGNEITVNYYIHQNTPYKINSIEFTGLDKIPENLSAQIFNHSDRLISLQSVYVKQNLEAEILRIVKILNNNGYVFAIRESVNIEKNLSEDPVLKNTLNIKVAFQTGEQYYFGFTTIRIENNKYGISEEDFRRELQFHEGELYNKKKILDSESRIASISLISTNSLTIDKIDSARNIIDYVLNLTLRNKYQIVPEIVGYSIQSKFYGGIGLSYLDNYFFNTNRTFNSRIRALFNSFEDIRVEFISQVSQPYLFNNERLTGNLGLSFDYWKEPEFQVQQYKTKLGVAYDLPEYTFINKVFMNWTLEYNDLQFNFSGGNTASELSFNYFNSRIGSDFLHDNTNNLSFPSTGYFQSFSIEETGLIGSLLRNIFQLNTFKFLKLTTLNKFYVNIFEKNNSPSVLGMKLLVGNIFPYGDNVFIINGISVPAENVPTDDKFTGGGANSNRGWRSRTLGILSNPELGGNFSFEGSIEHITRPFLDSDNFILKDFGFVTFFDFGNVWSDANKFRLNEIALSVGGGLRYYTVVGAVRLDLGFKLYDPRPGHVGVTNWIWQDGANFKDKYSIHIALGNSF